MIVQSLSARAIKSQLFRLRLSVMLPMASTAALVYMVHAGTTVRVTSGITAEQHHFCPPQTAHVSRIVSMSDQVRLLPCKARACDASPVQLEQLKVQTGQRATRQPAQLCACVSATRSQSAARHDGCFCSQLPNHVQRWPSGYRRALQRHSSPSRWCVCSVQPTRACEKRTSICSSRSSCPYNALLQPRIAWRESDLSLPSRAVCHAMAQAAQKPKLLQQHDC